MTAAIFAIVDPDVLLTVQATLLFGQREHARLDVFEAVEMVGNRAERTKYTYHAQYENDFLFRYDLNPSQHPEMPEHKHLPPDRRIPWDRVTRHDVAEELHSMVAEREGEEEAET